MPQRYVNTASTAGGDGTTNGTAGATRAYASLSAWEAARQADLVTAAAGEEVDCCGTAADTSAVVLAGWVVNATYYVTIRGNSADPAGRHQGRFSLNHYRLELAIDGPTLQTVDYTRMIGFQVWNTLRTPGDFNPALIDAATLGGLHCRIDSMIGRGVRYGADFPKGMYIRGASGVMVNCVIFDVGNALRGPAFQRGNNGVTGGGRAYNCTAYNCFHGFQTPDDGTVDADQLVVKNCVAYACNQGYEQSRPNFGTGSTNNADTGTTAPGANARNTQDMVATFVDTANGDLHLRNGNTTLQGFGANLSADASYPFSTDIDNQTRATWDIGADWFQAPPWFAYAQQHPGVQ